MGPIKSALSAITFLAALTSFSFAQEFRSSVVGTDFDFITAQDPTTFRCLEFKRKGYREMPDKSQDSLLIQEAYIFVAYFDDGTQIDIAIDHEFKDQQSATREANRYVKRLGKLPTSLRRGVKRMVVHKGNKDTTAFSDHGLIVVYSANASERISTHDLEETLFHESVHASWDKKYARSKLWTDAQAKDGKFITDYARKKPLREDLAESALFAYTLTHHPDRIPQEEADRIRKTIPARIQFVEKLIPKDKPVMYSVGPPYACDKSGSTFVVSKPGSEKPEQQFAKAGKANTNTELVCGIDLNKPGHVKDVASNALMLGFRFDEQRVSEFLDGAESRFATGNELLDSVAKEFEIDIQKLKSEIENFRHVNCTHKKLESKK